MSLAELPVITVGSTTYRKAGTVLYNSDPMVVLLRCERLNDEADAYGEVVEVTLWWPERPAYSMLTPTSATGRRLRQCQPETGMDLTVLFSYLRHLARQHPSANTQLVAVVMQTFQNAGFDFAPSTASQLQALIDQGML